MQKVKDSSSIILEAIEQISRQDASIIPGVKNKTIIDVGCGNGYLVRELTKMGASVTGIDIPRKIEIARSFQKEGDEEFLVGTAEKLPIEQSNHADIITFFASLHHVPRSLLKQAMREIKRVLKPGGIAIFVEPIGIKGSFFEMVKWVNNERRIQRRAKRTIEKGYRLGLLPKSMWTIYFERSFADFKNMIDQDVSNTRKKKSILSKARRATKYFSQKDGEKFEQFRFKSICRVDVLVKNK